MNKVHKYPLPPDIFNNDKSESAEIPSKYSKLFAKIKSLENLKTSRGSKTERKLCQRLSHVLNPTVDDQESLKQIISLDSSDLYVSFGVHKDSGSLASAKTSALMLTAECKKSVEESTPGDKVYEIKPKIGKKASKKLKKLEKEKTKGDKWYGMPATEVTEEIKNDLELLKMRGALDPKRFYKKSSNTEIPKYFQVISHLILFSTDKTHAFSFRLVGIWIHQQIIMLKAKAKSLKRHLWMN